MYHKYPNQLIHWLFFAIEDSQHESAHVFLYYQHNHTYTYKKSQNKKPINAIEFYSIYTVTHFDKVPVHVNLQVQQY